jgi:putative ABC transport system substrate-binding protein
MNEAVEPGALAVASPEGLGLSLHLTATRKSGPSPGAGLEWLQRTARRDFAIRVYE